jgi:hypothetical protein
VGELPIKSSSLWVIVSKVTRNKIVPQNATAGPEGKVSTQTKRMDDGPVDFSILISETIPNRKDILREEVQKSPEEARGIKNWTFHSPNKIGNRHTATAKENSRKYLPHNSSGKDSPSTQTVSPT